MDAPAPANGFILDCFDGLQAGRSVVFVTGRLETGETFGLVDGRRRPTLFVRASDAKSAALPPVLARHGVQLAPVPMTTMDGEPVLAAGTATVGDLRRLVRELHGLGVRTYEGDVDFAHGLLREHGLRSGLTLSGPSRASAQVGRVYVDPVLAPWDGGAGLRILAFDLETDVRTEAVIAASLVVWGAGGADVEEALVVGPPRPDDPEWLTALPDERALLARFAERVRALDPDVVTGWNIAEFDLPVLARRFERTGLPSDLARVRPPAGAKARLRQPALQGRQVLDGLRLVRSAALPLPDLKLQTVASVLLGRGKTIDVAPWEDKPAALLAAYENDRTSFSFYCLEDSRLVRDILKQQQLIELTVSRSRLIGLPLAQTWGSVASFEFLYMSELRRRGLVAPTRGVDRTPPESVPGGLVLAPQPGLHDGIFVLDFRSLYPSIIRTFNVDPLSHARAAGADGGWIVAPNGARFARERGILPEILDRFFVSRDDAKRRRDDVAAYAYKIIMNSFYGVLGTDSCRFASAALAGAITGFGQDLLRWTRAHLEARGLRVLYGDTDSLFVDAGAGGELTEEAAKAQGEALAADATVALAAHVQETWGVDSRLTLQFESYYRRLLLPRGRDGEAGRAKSYAGLTAAGELDITGMEAVRSDWTPLARGLQRELLTLLFEGAEAAKLAAHTRKTVQEVLAGRRDAELVYRKSLRKKLSSYTKTNPPHVQAARLLPPSRFPSRTIYYFMTVEGPQPLGFAKAPLDYEHYVEKQLAPIAEMLGEWFDAGAALGRAVPARSLFGD